MPKKRMSKVDRLVDWTKLPAVSSRLAQDVEDYLTTRFETKKPPRVSAAVLALIIELDARSIPFPSREQVAHELNCSVWGVDSALTVALSRGLLTIAFDTKPSSRTKDHVIQLKYYHPDREFLEAVGRAPKFKVVA